VTRINSEGLNLKDKVVYINRVAKVVKGGRRFSFTALVVVGDGEGIVGTGKGKASEVPEAIRKAVDQAKKSLIRFPIKETTIPHKVVGRFGPHMNHPEQTGIIERCNYCPRLKNCCKAKQSHNPSPKHHHGFNTTDLEPFRS
jgi:hypothetical protein